MLDLLGLLTYLAKLAMWVWYGILGYLGYVGMVSCCFCSSSSALNRYLPALAGLGASLRRGVSTCLTCLVWRMGDGGWKIRRDRVRWLGISPPGMARYLSLAVFLHQGRGRMGRDGMGHDMNVCLYDVPVV